MTLFTDKAPGIMNLLIGDFHLDEIEAAAIVGNLGHESGGFKSLQEKKPMVPGSRGGWGWAQWTGPRRRAFEAYCARNNLDPASDKANYGWLFVELTTTEKAAIPALKEAVGMEAKVRAFEKSFERAGIKHYPSRVTYAYQALTAWQKSQVAFQTPKDIFDPPIADDPGPAPEKPVSALPPAPDTEPPTLPKKRASDAPARSVFGVVLSIVFKICAGIGQALNYLRSKGK